MLDIEVLYIQQIRGLPPEARLQLLALIAQDLAAASSKQHRITDLQGLGKEIWQGIDAQDYIDQMRREWDERP
jgi:hypothetical protein